MSSCPESRPVEAFARRSYGLCGEVMADLGGEVTRAAAQAACSRPFGATFLACAVAVVEQPDETLDSRPGAPQVLVRVGVLQCCPSAWSSSSRRFICSLRPPRWEAQRGLERAAIAALGTEVDHALATPPHACWIATRWPCGEVTTRLTAQRGREAGGDYLARRDLQPATLSPTLNVSEALDFRVAGVGDRVDRERDQPGGDDAQ